MMKVQSDLLLGAKLPDEFQQRKPRRVDYKLNDDDFYGARYIFECGYKLKAAPVTIAAAALIYHKFMRAVDPSNYDRFLIAATCLYIAGKVKDDMFKIRDIINVAHHTLHREVAPLDLKDEYWNRRDAIVQAELLVMRVLQFDVNLTTAHKYLLHYLMSLKTWISLDLWDKVPIPQCAYGFLQDIYHDPAVLEFTPQAIALGCINLAMQCYGVDVPYVKETEETGWFTILCNQVNKEKMWDVIEVLVELYSKE